MRLFLKKALKIFKHVRDDKGDPSVRLICVPSVQRRVLLRHGDGGGGNVYRGHGGCASPERIQGK